MPWAAVKKNRIRPMPKLNSKQFAYGAIAAVLVTIVARVLSPEAPSGDGVSINGAYFSSDAKMFGTVQQVTGGGTRIKYNVAKVYAVALYIDSRAAASSLKRFAGGKQCCRGTSLDVAGRFRMTNSAERSKSALRHARRCLSMPCDANGFHVVFNQFDNVTMVEVCGMMCELTRLWARSEIRPLANTDARPRDHAT